jgi:uncharacterized protein (DUF2225 family)
MKREGGNRDKLECPGCGTPFSRVHSHYNLSFQELRLLGKKVVIILNNRKMFCDNSDCQHTTFAETFDFIAHKAKKTKRLKEEIIRVALTWSPISASQYLRSSVADLRKNSICNYLKKGTPLLNKCKRQTRPDLI